MTCEVCGAPMVMRRTMRWHDQVLGVERGEVPDVLVPVAEPHCARLESALIVAARTAGASVHRPSAVLEQHGYIFCPAGGAITGEGGTPCSYRDCQAVACARERVDRLWAEDEARRLATKVAATAKGVAGGQAS